MTMLRTIDLRAAAAIEAARIAAARAIARPDDGPAREWLAGRRPWIATWRSGRRRSNLRGGAVLIWRVGAEDSGGGEAAASIVAMRAAFGGSARMSQAIARDALVQLLSHPPDAIASVLRDRTGEVVLAARAFANARLARERAVAASGMASRRDAPAYQPGLFDRRAERARLAAAAYNAMREDAAAGRVAAAQAAADLAGARPQLLLALIG